MRLMILRAALLAADTELAAGAPEATADPESVQASAADETGATGPLPTAAQAAELAKAGAIAGNAPADTADPSSSSSKLDEAIARAAKDAEAARGSGENSGQMATRDPRPAPMAGPVIVRQSGRLAPGIVVEEDAGEGITVQVFRGDHLPHVAHHLTRAEPEGTQDGWFFPWERSGGLF